MNKFKMIFKLYPRLKNNLHRKLKFLSFLLFLMSSALSLTAHAAQAPASAYEDIFQEEAIQFDNKDFIDENSIFGIQQNPNESLIQQVFSGLMRGDTNYDLKALQEEWEANPSSITKGVVITLALIREKQYDKALAVAKKLQNLKPDFFEGYALAGIIYSLLDRNDLSVTAFNKALALEPGQPSVSYNLAKYALKEGKIEQARTLYENVLTHHPKHLQTLLSLSMLEANANHQERSTSLLNQAIKFYPEALEPRVILARQLLIADKPQDAIQIIEPITNKFPKSPALLDVKGRAELIARDYNAALQSLSSLADVKPSDAMVHFYLAATYEGLGGSNDALKELDKVLELNPQHKQSKLVKARILTREGDARKALVIYEDLYKNAPENNVLLAMARLRWSLGEHDDSIQLLENWIKDHPDDESILVELAKAYEIEKRKEDAINIYHIILAISENNIVALNNLGWALQDKDTDKALRYAQKARSLNPKSPVILDTLAVILLKMGDLAKAEEIIKQALQQAPDNPSLLYRQASILEKSGKKKNAEKIIRSILKSNVHFPERVESEKMLQRLGVM